MRESGRSDAGDARPDRTDVLTEAEVGDVGVPADGGAAVPHASEQADTAATGTAATDPTAPGSPTDAPAPDTETADTETPHAGSPDTGSPDTGSPDAAAADDPDDVLGGLADLGDDLGDVPDYPGDDVLFDPLLSDEPIDLAAVRADDALIDALGGGDLDAAHDLIDAEDPLIAMLAAWAASARPDEDPEPECGRPSLRLVGATPDVPAQAEPPERADGAAPLVATGREAALAPASDDSTADDSTADDLTADDPAPAAVTTPVGTVRRLVPPPVLGVLDRARIARRRTTPQGRPLPAGHPLRRAAVAVVVTALGVSAAAAAGGTARPGEAGFAMTRVFFAERAESLVAAEVVADGLDRARAYIAQRQPALAAQELAAVENRLPDVRDEEGHRQLVGQQQELADTVALTPPAPPDQRGTGPTTRGADPGTSILAESAPPATVPDTTTPDTRPGAADVVAPPSEDAVPGEASTPAAGPVAPGGAGTANTPSEVVASTVSGASDEGTGTAEPTPVTGTSAENATTTVTATSAPTDRPTTTSGTTAPTTSSSTPAPPTSTRAQADDGGTVATGSVPAGGSPIAARPASHHETVDHPVAVAEPAGAGDAAQAPGPADDGGTPAGGSVDAASDDDDDAPFPIVRAVAPRPAPHPAPVVVTTVPRPVPAAADDAADADAAAAKAKAKAKPGSGRSAHDRRGAANHRSPGGAGPAGARLSGAGEVRVPAATSGSLSRAR